ncbi:MAG TPA: hypothetical protein VKR32_00290 [Puia sp.]|nr:hypothetical protein [Puia sp.]
MPRLCDLIFKPFNFIIDVNQFVYEHHCPVLIHDAIRRERSTAMFPIGIIIFSSHSYLMQSQQAYMERIRAGGETIRRLKKISSFIAAGRLVVILILLAGGWALWQLSIIFSLGLMLLLAALFIKLVLTDSEISERIREAELIVSINQKEVEIANGNFAWLPDGLLFVPHHHDNAQDLDLFGRSSIFQFINRAVSEQGHARLAAWLLDPAATNIIVPRQQAVSELSDSIDFSQRLQLLGIDNPVTCGMEKKLRSWLEQQDMFSHRAAWKLIRYAYPILPALSTLLFAIGSIPGSLYFPLLLCFFIFSGWISKRISPEYNQVNRIVTEIETLYQSVECIEKQNWRAPFLFERRQQLAGEAGNMPASVAIREFKRILDRFDLRLNILVFVVINTFFLWDLQIVFQLESWRKRNTRSVANWFHVLAEMEAINSLAILKYNHPSWAFPVFDPVGSGTFSASGLGHPLIPIGRCVRNDFSTRGNGQIALVTGSNMAGKSTFLRSIGVNMVLATMGSPVCAESMRLEPFRVMSSMRVNDNLEENESTFYAELKKLKHIIESTNRHERLFLLLDEILRGTNSLDRHSGSVALIRQLLKEKAVGIVATHDLGLTTLAEAYPDEVRNFHFDVSVNGEELVFDYKLKDGICQSMNATLLMKKIGINM